MADTIRILAKKAYRFQKPGSDIMTLAAPEKPNVPAPSDIIFVATVGQICEAPAWIKEDPLFDMVTKEDNLHVVSGREDIKPPEQKLFEEQQKQYEEQQRLQKSEQKAEHRAEAIKAEHTGKK